MKLRKLSEKKGTMGQVVTIFITILIISVLAGVTFLFLGQLKTSSANLSSVTLTVVNESQLSTVGGAMVYANTTGYTVENASLRAFSSPVIDTIWVDYNQTQDINGLYDVTNGTATGYNVSVSVANVSISSTGVLTNNTQYVYGNLSLSYHAGYVPDSNSGAWTAVNTTESAGLTVTTFLSILFLAMIFSAILTVVLRFVMPFLNLGDKLGGF